MSKGKKEKEIKEIEINDEEATEEVTNEGVQEEVKETVKEEDKVKDLQLEVSELKDKLLRKAAEFENYKRRTENDQLSLLTYAAESFIQKLLPVIDDFERSLEHINDAQDIDAIKNGLKLIYDKFMKALDEQGVKKIDAVGKLFDVDFHEALMQRPDDSVEPHTVLEEIEKGYTYKDKVLRHSKVIVSEDNGGASGNEEKEEEN
ncbi:MAG: nucleotide exchange factor GrpE [Ignavibacterium sp.]|nr:MAG: nucleotide exchange factor GrpE [Ignavibacterium sp.]